MVRQGGHLFADDKTLNIAKRAGNAFIKLTDTNLSRSSVGLPTPYELTGNQDWDTNGELLKEYDLQLKLRSVSTCVNGVLIPEVDTGAYSEPIDNPDKPDDIEEGVKVSTPKPSADDYFVDLMTC